MQPGFGSRGVDCRPEGYKLGAFQRRDQHFPRQTALDRISLKVPPSPGGRREAPSTPRGPFTFAGPRYPIHLPSTSRTRTPYLSDMPKETQEEKALRYVREGRVTVVFVDPLAHTALLEFQGSSDAPYQTSYENGFWTCKCPAHVTLCVHKLIAGWLVRFPAEAPEFAPADPELDALLGSG